MSARILLVDDDDNDVFLMKRALQRAGVREPIHVAWDGREALNYLQGEGSFGHRNQYPLPCVVLLDLKLPHIMGLDVLKWIRQQDQFKSTVVIVLSASQSAEDIANAYRYGANAYLVKPGTVNQLDDVARTIRDSWLNAAVPPTPQISLTALGIRDSGSSPAKIWNVDDALAAI